MSGHEPTHTSAQIQVKYLYLKKLLFQKKLRLHSEKIVFNLHFNFHCSTQFAEQLNWEQQMAIKSIVKRESGSIPFLLFGPPSK